MFKGHDFRIHWLDYNSKGEREYEIICQRCDYVVDMTDSMPMKEYEVP